MGPPDQLVLPAFFFQKPVSAPAGIYDIALAGEIPQYLAKTSQGALVLTSSSTGTTAIRRNGQTTMPSIFGVDCKGRVTVSQADTPYTWDISGTTTTFTSGTRDRSMVTYSLSRSTPNSRTARRSRYTESAQPRCPDTPPDLVAKAFPSARPLNPNGCGASQGFDFVPDFSFGSCCDGHDNCFDNCESGTFEGCNNQFHDCMRGQGACASSIKTSQTAPKQKSCLRQPFLMVSSILMHYRLRLPQSLVLLRPLFVLFEDGGLLLLVRGNEYRTRCIESRRQRTPRMLL